MAKMKVKDVIKKGILEGNWDLICQAYTAITGEKISPPLQIMEMEVSNSQSFQPHTNPLQQVHPLQKKNSLGRIHQNRFVDNFTEATKDLKRVGDMKKLYNEEFVERRPPSQLVPVKCSCGNIDNLLPEIANQYLIPIDSGGSEYKCQRCVLRNNS